MWAGEEYFRPISLDDLAPIDKHGAVGDGVGEVHRMCERDSGHAIARDSTVMSNTALTLWEGRAPASRPVLPTERPSSSPLLCRLRRDYVRIGVCDDDRRAIWGNYRDLPGVVDASCIRANSMYNKYTINVTFGPCDGRAT